MRAIDKFILHVVHNWTNELNEAYSEKAISDFIKYFQDQADKLNTQITDDELRSYIKTFDRVKAKLSNTEQDLRQYTLSDLIAIATSVEDKEATPEQIDVTPDVVYHNDDNSIVIYNGSREDLCIKYGKGEKWCITRTSFPTYRGSEARGYPTFYLARNNNPIPNGDKLSFVAIQVRDPEMTNPDSRYVYTNRQNSPNESRPMSFSELLSEIPWLSDIPNVQSVLQYIPVSKAEKATQKYKGNAIPVSDWLGLDFRTKKQYLIQRKNKDLFDDINGNDFVRDYLPKYPELAVYIAKNYGILPPVDLLRNLDKFKEGDKKSILINLQEKVNLDQLEKSIIPFNVKQALVTYDRWDVPLDTRLYNTTFVNSPAIAELELDPSDGEINVNLYLKLKKYPNIKGKAEYIANYPQLDKLPFKSLMWAASNGVIGRNKLDATLEAAKDDPNSPLIVRDKENGKLVLDASSYTVYNLEGESVVKIPTDDDEAKDLINAVKTNPAFQENTINIVKQSIGTSKSLPVEIDRDAFTSTVDATPYNKRIIQGQGDQYLILKPENEPDDTRYALFARKINDKTDLRADYTFGNSRTWREFDTRNVMSQSMWASYFKYLRSINQPYTDDELLEVMRGYDNNSKRTFIRANPPLASNSRYAVANYNDAYYLIDKVNPRESKRLSDRRDTLNKTVVPPELLRQVLGQQTPTPRPAAPVAPAAPAAQAVPAAPVAQAGNDASRLIVAAGLTNGFATLPTSIQQKIQAGTSANPRLERSARSRDAELGARGNVTGVIVSGQSKMFIIRLASGANIAQISIQPEARHYVVTSTTSFNMGRVGNFISSLDQRNIAEAARNYVKKYPHKLNKVQEIIQRYINETRKH